MLASLLILALAVLNAAEASTSRCKPAQLGKYAPLFSDRATQQYCAAFLDGKAPRGIEERAGRTTLECLQSDFKKEWKTYQSAVCSCIVTPTTTTISKSSTKCTTKTKTSTKCTTTATSATTQKTVSTTKSSTTTSSSTTSSAAPAPLCTQDAVVASKYCRYIQNCDTKIAGEVVGEPTQQSDETSCFAFCDDNNVRRIEGCAGYNYDLNTQSCEIFSTVSGDNPARGVRSGQLLGCTYPDGQQR